MQTIQSRTNLMGKRLLLLFIAMLSAGWLTAEMINTAVYAATSVVSLAPHNRGEDTPASLIVASSAGLMTHTVTINTSGNGSVHQDPDQVTYTLGTVVTLTAIPDPGSVFTGWTGHLTGTTNPYSITITGDITATAHFTSADSIVASDDFNDCLLNSGIWTFVDPLNDATMALTGTHLSMSVPAGTAHDVWTGVNNAPRLRQTVPDSDFDLIVKFDSGVSQQYQGQGVLIEQDNNDLLRYEFVRHNTNNTNVFAASIVNGGASGLVNTPIGSSNITPLYLRVTRVGDDWTFQYSFDGENWNTALAHSRAMTVSTISIHVLNAVGVTSPAHTAVVDYFFNSDIPINPEDDNTHQPDINVIGSGQTTTTPDQAAYDCGEMVTLSAVADPGWTFTQWDGPVSGGNVTLTHNISTNNTFTATFLPSLGDGPGSVGSTDGGSILGLWLRGDEGVFGDGGCSITATNGGNVGCWADQSGNGYNATASGTEPILHTTGLAGQSTLEFDGSSDRLATPSFFLFNTPSSGLTTFTIFDTDDNDGEKYLLNMGMGADNDFELGYDTGSQTGVGNFGLHRDGGDAAVAPAGTIANDIFGILTAAVLPTGSSPNNVDIWQDGTALSVANDNAGWLNAGSYETVSNPLNIGARDDQGLGVYDAYHDGDIAEVIVFGSILNSAQRTIVENYLNAKYAITISNDFYTSTVYSMTVAGIGAEVDGNHSQARSDGLILTEDNSALGAGEYVLMGHRTPANGNEAGDVTSPVVQRWTRVWRVEKTGDVDVTMTFDFSEGGMEGSAGDAADYVLLYSSVNAFTWTEHIVGADAVNGDQVTFDVANAELPNGYYTLATRDAQGSPTAINLFGISTNSATPGTAVLLVLLLVIVITAAFLVWRRKSPSTA
jgi:uncharacterized repeat protein (TIGR02543 family)